MLSRDRGQCRHIAFSRSEHLFRRSDTTNGFFAFVNTVLASSLGCAVDALAAAEPRARFPHFTSLKSSPLYDSPLTFIIFWSFQRVTFTAQIHSFQSSFLFFFLSFRDFVLLMGCVVATEATKHSGSRLAILYFSLPRTSARPPPLPIRRLFSPQHLSLRQLLLSPYASTTGQS